MRPRCFWGINFINCLLTRLLLKNIFRINFFSSLSDKIYILNFLCRSALKPIFHWKAHLFTSLRSLFGPLADLLGTLIVENRDVSSVNNLGLHWRLSDTSLMYIRNKGRPNVEPWETSAFILSQHELWPLRITLFCIFLKKSVKKLNIFP